MRGFLGLIAGSKGMGRIPALLNLTLAQARTAIANAGFFVGTETALDNAAGATSTNNGKAINPDNYDQLAQYESLVDIDYYVYTAPPYSFTPYSFTPFSFVPAFTFIPAPPPPPLCPPPSVEIYWKICNCAPWCGIPGGCGVQGDCELFGNGADCFVGCLTYPT
jgi:hypothetical protein